MIFSCFHSSKWLDSIPDNALDFILATEILEHIEGVGTVLSDFRKKLKPGGKLIISLPTEDALYKLGRKIAGFSGEYHQEDIMNMDEVYKQENYKLVKKLSIPAPGFFCLYKLYLFSN